MPAASESAAPRRAIATISSWSSARLRAMCVPSQSPNDSPVAEAGVDGVLEVRVRVDEPRQDHRAVVVALGAPAADLDDAAVLPGHVARLSSGGPSTGITQPAETARSRLDGGAEARGSAVERRSSRTESQIEQLEQDRRAAPSRRRRRHRVDAGQRDRDAAARGSSRCGGSCAACRS